MLNLYMLSLTVAELMAPECRIFSLLLAVRRLLFSRRHHRRQQLLVRVVVWFLGTHLNLSCLIQQCLEAWFLAP